MNKRNTKMPLEIKYMPPGTILVFYFRDSKITSMPSKFF